MSVGRFTASYSSGVIRRSHGPGIIRAIGFLSTVACGVPGLAATGALLHLPRPYRHAEEGSEFGVNCLPVGYEVFESRDSGIDFHVLLLHSLVEMKFRMADAVPRLCQ